MFAKLSLKSFIYSIVELLYFPEKNPTVATIYEKYDIEKIHCCHILTDTDSTSLQFVIISNADSPYPESKAREILFEIFSKTELSERFDKSDDFWSRLNVQQSQDKKVLGLYEVEHINEPCYVILAVIPKEYFGLFKSKKVNKKHKGIKKKVLKEWNTIIMLKELNLCLTLTLTKCQNPVLRMWCEYLLKRER